MSKFIEVKLYSDNNPDGFVRLINTDHIRYVEPTALREKAFIWYGDYELNVENSYDEIVDKIVRAEKLEEMKKAVHAERTSGVAFKEEAPELTRKPMYNAAPEGETQKTIYVTKHDLMEIYRKRMNYIIWVLQNNIKRRSAESQNPMYKEKCDKDLAWLVEKESCTHEWIAIVDNVATCKKCLTTVNIDKPEEDFYL